MNFLQTVLSVVHVASAFAVVVLVLLQQGKGAEMGAAFGGGSSASGSLFGATGSANFLSRLTAVCATIFLLCTLGLAFQAHQGGRGQSGGVMEKLNTQAPKSPVSGSVGSAPTAADAKPAVGAGAAAGAPTGAAPAAPSSTQDIPK